MAFLTQFSWNAILDFDQTPEEGGLQTLYKNSKQMKVMMINEFSDPETTQHPSNIGLQSDDLPWVFANGHKEYDPETPDTHLDWMMKGYQFSLQTALRKYQEFCKDGVQLSAVVVVNSDRALEQMSSTVDYLFTIGFRSDGDCQLMVISLDSTFLTGLLKHAQARLALKSLCHTFMLDELKHVVNSIAEERNTPATPSTDGLLRLVQSESGTSVVLDRRTMADWRDLQVLSCDECEDRRHSPDRLEEVAAQFYKGHEPCWLNFYCGHDVGRTVTATYRSCIETELQDLQSNSLQSKAGFSFTWVRTVTIKHRSGTGGTTLGARLLWSFRKEFRCARIGKLSSHTGKYIRAFQRIGESPHISPAAMKPVLLLIDNPVSWMFDSLRDTLDQGKTKSVIIHIQPLYMDDAADLHSSSSSQSGYTRPFPGQTTFNLPHRLDQQEVTMVKDIISRFAHGPTRMRAAKTTEQQCGFIYAGLELFGQEYNLARLQAFIKEHLDSPEMADQHRGMLQYCSLIYQYSHKAIPRGCFLTTYVGLENISPGAGYVVGELTPVLSDLLLTYTEHLEPPIDCCYTGYRPAHALIATEILNQSEASLISITGQFLEDMFTSGNFAIRHLMDLTMYVFTRRTFFSNSDDDETLSSDDDESEQDRREREAHHYVYPGRQGKPFSPLVMAILRSNEGARKAVQLVLTLCQKADESKYYDRAFAWQLLARLFAHKFKLKLIPKEAAMLLGKILSTSNEFWVPTTESDS